MTDKRRQEIIDAVLEHAFCALVDSGIADKRMLELFVKALILEAREIDESIDEIMDTMSESEGSDIGDAVNDIFRGKNG